MTPLPAVLLLDLDDTIVSFNASHRNFWGEAYDAHADLLRDRLERQSFVDAVMAFGAGYWRDPDRAHRGRMDLQRARREVVHGSFETLGMPAADVADRVADHFTIEKEAAVAPFDGAVDAVRSLRARGVRLGLVTNGSSEFQRAKLRRYALEPLFEAIVVEGEWGVGKPDPTIFLEALRLLGATPKEAWMVGDNLSADVGGAQSVGMQGVWHDYAHAGLPAKLDATPDRIIHHLADLL